MNKYSWQSKGQTLLWLEKKLLKSSVPRLIVFTFEEWVNNSDKILLEIKNQFSVY